MLSRAIRPIIATAFAVMIALGTVFGTPQPALAALSGSVYCGPSGGGNFVCVASTGSAVAPVAFTWTGVSNATITSIINSTDTSIAQGKCTLYRTASVKVTAKDSTGATITSSTSFFCSPIGLPPPSLP